jgi:hypothetical protein
MSNPKFLSLIFLVILFSAPGCMSTRLVGDYSTDNILPNRKTTITYAWGLLQAQDIAAGCESKTICQVTTQTNIGYILVAAVTLGLVVPQKISWECCTSVVKEEKLN